MAIAFAKRVFQIAGFWGLFILSLGYATYLAGLEGSTIDTDRPEFVHGFFLIGLAWQLAFLFIATDPMRYRPLMLVATLEKLPFTLAVIYLYANGQVPPTMLALGLIDGLLGMLFTIAYVWTGQTAIAE